MELKLVNGRSIWVIYSRHTGNILDAAVSLISAKARADEYNTTYQSDEYVVKEWI